RQARCTGAHRWRRASVAHSHRLAGEPRLEADRRLLGQHAVAQQDLVAGGEVLSSTDLQEALVELTTTEKERGAEGSRGTDGLHELIRDGGESLSDLPGEEVLLGVLRDLPASLGINVGVELV